LRLTGLLGRVETERTRKSSCRWVAQVSQFDPGQWMSRDWKSKWMDEVPLGLYVRSLQVPGKVERREKD
jgi:hypothetical protein